MSDDSQSEKASQSSREAWDEVGRQFEQLGQSLSQAFRAAWNDDENRQKVQDMREGVEAMISQVGEAIRDTAQSERGQQIRDEAGQAVKKVVEAGEQTVQDARPHIIDALKHLNAELQKLTERMERSSSAVDPQDRPEA